MNIKLIPKYEIGQKIDVKVFIDEKLASTKHFIINNIKATYDFASEEITYDYELRLDDEFGYIYGWFKLS
ncbi:MAG: hypothetical protein WDA59_00140 [Methanofastidiosum sp.]|jgi:hypothetical protein